MDRTGTDRIEIVEAEVAVLRQLVWRLITRVPGGADDARTALRLMLPGSRRRSAVTAVNAVEMLSRLPAIERPVPSPAALPAAAMPLSGLEALGNAGPGCKTCPDCGPDMLITVLIEDDGRLLPPGTRRHLLRCMGCRYEERRIVDLPST